MGQFRFFLGTHIPSWLGILDIPLFISRRLLHKRKTFPRALGPWMQDSGGFTELSMFGEWRTGPEEYARDTRRHMDEIGNMYAASIQDWMCESAMIKGTGLSVMEHQKRSVRSYLDLKSLAPDIPWMPVLQGWSASDYWRCVQLYEKEGIDLTQEKIVGVGTMCRRQNTRDAVLILEGLSQTGIPLHGFGFKKTGLAKVHRQLASADSMAWSFDGRRSPPLPGHASRHINCANCIDYALIWHKRLLEIIREN